MNLTVGMFKNFREKGSITVQLTSCLSGLDLTKQVKKLLIIQ